MFDATQEVFESFKGKGIFSITLTVLSLPDITRQPSLTVHCSIMASSYRENVALLYHGNYPVSMVKQEFEWHRNET